MKECPKCGYCADDERDAPDMESGDDEARLKSELLAELMDTMKGSMGDRLKSIKKKPVAVSVEMMSAKPADDEDEDV